MSPKPKTPKSPEQLERLRRWLHPTTDNPNPELTSADVAWLVAAYASNARALETAEVTVHTLRAELAFGTQSSRSTRGRADLVRLTAGVLASNQTADPVEAVKLARQALNFIDGNG